MVFEYVEKNLLEVLEENTVGIDVSKINLTTSERPSEKHENRIQNLRTRENCKAELHCQNIMLRHFITTYLFYLFPFSPNAYASMFIR